MTLAQDLRKCAEVVTQKSAKGFVSRATYNRVNERRCELIRRNVYESSLTVEEKAELAMLQDEIGRLVDLAFPHPTILATKLAELEKTLVDKYGPTALDFLKDKDDKPQFKHDCDNCEFIGTFTDAGKNYDLYYCGQGGHRPTVIARYEDGGSGYMSGIGVDLPPLVEAQARAQKRYPDIKPPEDT